MNKKEKVLNKFLDILKNDKEKREKFLDAVSNLFTITFDSYCVEFIHNVVDLSFFVEIKNVFNFNVSDYNKIERKLNKFFLILEKLYSIKHIQCLYIERKKGFEISFLEYIPCNSIKNYLFYINLIKDVFKRVLKDIYSEMIEKRKNLEFKKVQYDNSQIKYSSKVKYIQKVFKKINEKDIDKLFKKELDAFNELEFLPHHERYSFYLEYKPYARSFSRKAYYLFNFKDRVNISDKLFFVESLPVYNEKGVSFFFTVHALCSAETKGVKKALKEYLKNNLRKTFYDFIDISKKVFIKTQN